MRLSVPAAAIFAALLHLSIPGPALAGRDYAPSYIHRLARVEVFDRTAGHTLPVHVHENRLYVVGEPGHQYEVRLDNRTSERLLAVTSVDGVNVITGKTADERQSGYVLDPRDSVTIEGWRKSLDEVATFYFTRLSDSYAARTGRPENVGVIGVAVFRERRPCCRPYPYHDRDSAASQSSPERAKAPAAADESLHAVRRTWAPAMVIARYHPPSTWTFSAGRTTQPRRSSFITTRGRTWSPAA